MIKCKIMITASIVFFTLLGCFSNISTTNKHFKSIEKKFTPILLDEIKLAEEDSLFRILPNFINEYNNIIGNGVYEKNWINLIDTNFVKENYQNIENILLFAFQKHLKKEQINLIEIKDEVEKIKEQHEIDWKKEEENRKIRLLSIIKQNEKNWEEGDTINLLFPIREEGGNQAIYYEDFPASFYTLENDKKLKIKGVLLRKFYNENLFKNISGVDKALTLFFYIKIMHFNSKETYYNFELEKMEVGDELEVYLGLYGQLIE